MDREWVVVHPLPLLLQGGAYVKWPKVNVFLYSNYK